MMNRREFIRHITLVTAGALTLPEQILAFERQISINTIPGIEKGLISAGDIILSGIANRSTVVHAHFACHEGIELRFAFNAFGGIFRWIASLHDTLRITTPDKLSWEIWAPNEDHPPLPEKIFVGGLRYIDQNGVQHHASFSDGYKIINNKICGNLQMVMDKAIHLSR